MTNDITFTDEVQQTLAEYERLAISTGEAVQIDPPEFWSGVSAVIGTDWMPIWSGTTPPKFARATVHRNGVPTTVYVSWDESLPAEDSWRALWLRKPMKLFGAYTLRTALRRAFRDVIGDRREPDEMPDAAPAPAPEASVEREWLTMIAAATTRQEVEALHVMAKAERAVTVEIEREIRKRIAALAAPPAESTPKPRPPKASV